MHPETSTPLSQPPGLVPPMKLFGAEQGKVIPHHPLRDGIYLLEPDGSLRNVPATMRFIGEQKKRTNSNYARQYLQKKRGDKFTESEVIWETFLLNLHDILVDPASIEAGVSKPVFSLPLTLVHKGVMNETDMEMLPLRALADGEMQRLNDEYTLFMEIQLPPYPTQEQRSQILEEGKTCALSTLHSRHGSSALIQVLHGLGKAPWPE